MGTQDIINEMNNNLKKAVTELIFAQVKANKFINWSQMILLKDTLSGILTIINTFIDEFNNYCD